MRRGTVHEPAAPRLQVPEFQVQEHEVGCDRSGPREQEPARRATAHLLVPSLRLECWRDVARGPASPLSHTPQGATSPKAQGPVRTIRISKKEMWERPLVVSSAGAPSLAHSIGFRSTE